MPTKEEVETRLYAFAGDHERKGDSADRWNRALNDELEFMVILVDYAERKKLRGVKSKGSWVNWALSNQATLLGWIATEASRAKPSRPNYAKSAATGKF